MIRRQKRMFCMNGGDTIERISRFFARQIFTAITFVRLQCCRTMMLEFNLQRQGDKCKWLKRVSAEDAEHIVPLSGWQWNPNWGQFLVWWLLYHCGREGCFNRFFGGDELRISGYQRSNQKGYKFKLVEYGMTNRIYSLFFLAQVHLII